MRSEKSTSFPLMLRLLFMHFVSVAGGCVIITLRNLYVNGTPLEELWEFNIKALMIGGALFVLILQAISLWRLRFVIQYFKGHLPDINKERVITHMLRFPAELFWGVMILALVFSILFHIAALIYYGVSPTEADKRLFLALMNTMLSEQALALTISIMLYTLTRSSLRPYVNQLQMFQLGELNKESIVRLIMIYYVSCLLLVVLNPLLYVNSSILYDEPFELPVLFWMTAFYAIFATLLFVFMIIQLRKELRTMIEGIRSLTRGDRNKLHSKMAIFSRDELGQLADAFNELQDQISKEYDELDKELELAYKVQQQLLPQDYQEIGEWSISARCRQIKEIGGDLYDIVYMDEQRLAVIIGDVSGNGMQAALVMSALMVLFRMEAKQGGSAGEVLSRLNRTLSDTLQGDMMITLGLAICYLPNGMVEYASAGHVSPYSVLSGQVKQHKGSSLPLGIDPQQEYSEITFTLRKGEQLVLYTDGIIKGIDHSAEQAGFERLEQLLENVASDAGVQSVVDHIFDSLQISVDLKYADNSTAVVMKWGGRL